MAELRSSSVDQAPKTKGRTLGSCLQPSEFGGDWISATGKGRRAEPRIAISDGEVIGMWVIRLATSVVEQLFVRPSHIGRQIGKALLQDAMNSMPDGFTLFTATTNRRAQAFYERQGLVFLREGPDPRKGHPVSFYGWNAD